MQPIHVYSASGECLGKGQVGLDDEGQMILLRLDSGVAEQLAKSGGELRLGKEEAFTAFMGFGEGNPLAGIGNPLAGAPGASEGTGHKPLSSAHEKRIKAAVAAQVEQFRTLHPELVDLLDPLEPILLTVALGMLSLTSARRRPESIRKLETEAPPLTVENGRIVHQAPVKKPTDMPMTVRFGIPRIGADRFHVEIEAEQALLPFLRALAASIPDLPLPTAMDSIKEFAMPWIFRTFAKLDMGKKTSASSRSSEPSPPRSSFFVPADVPEG